MKNHADDFIPAGQKALRNPQLQRALQTIPGNFIAKRQNAFAPIADLENWREKASHIRRHSIENMGFYLQQFEENAVGQGAQVHWAQTAQEANELVEAICNDVDAKTIVKGKSMVSEETSLNHYLHAKGFEVYETDLGEYVIQIRGERPSHIITPAVHLSQDQIKEDFLNSHEGLAPSRPLDTPEALVGEARTLLRERFLTADVGITGANFLIAETGSTVLVTNEGNGDLCQSLPKTHITLTTIDKIVPTRTDTNHLLRLLARSATGQDISTYTSFRTGAKRAKDIDGPSNVHIILMDNGRLDLVGSKLEEMLHCIRCGACMNHCPVYAAVGGHSYGWVYPGPMGAVLTPSFTNLKQSHHLPFASSFCGRCVEVCPVKIPLTKLMRQLRTQAFEDRIPTLKSRFILKLWRTFALRPRLYHGLLRGTRPLLNKLLANATVARRLPLTKAWRKTRDLPYTEAESMQKLYKALRAQKKEPPPHG